MCGCLVVVLRCSSFLRWLIAVVSVGALVFVFGVVCFVFVLFGFWTRFLWSHVQGDFLFGWVVVFKIRTCLASCRTFRSGSALCCIITLGP